MADPIETPYVELENPEITETPIEDPNENPNENPNEAQKTTEPQPDITTSFNNIFNQSNLTYFLGFLGIYFIIYFVLGKFFNNSEITSTFTMGLSWSIDLIFLSILIFTAIALYSGYNSNKNLPEQIYKKISDFISNPNSIIITGLFLLSFYLIIYMFRIPNEYNTKPYFISLIENMAWIVLVFILIWDFFKYILKISLFDVFPFLNTEKPKEVPKEASKEVVDKKEVFNIGNNIYTYDDARSICSIYNADLATYDQIEKAYNNGAEWCNYGWSSGQMALFPTQKETWAKLQVGESEFSTSKKAYTNHKNDCGRPGINGGYIDNPYVKFGVNCYGKKPNPTDDDIARMNAKQEQIYPSTIHDEELDSKVKYWKNNKDKLIKMNPYNLQKWAKTDK
jgi:hypothetical protein